MAINQISVVDPSSIQVPAGAANDPLINQINRLTNQQIWSQNNLQASLRFTIGADSYLGVGAAGTPNTPSSFLNWGFVGPNINSIGNLGNLIRGYSNPETEKANALRAYFEFDTPIKVGNPQVDDADWYLLGKLTFGGGKDASLLGAVGIDIPRSAGILGARADQGFLSTYGYFDWNISKGKIDFSWDLMSGGAGKLRDTRAGLTDKSKTEIQLIGVKIVGYGWFEDSSRAVIYSSRVLQGVARTFDKANGGASRATARFSEAAILAAAATGAFVKPQFIPNPGKNTPLELTYTGRVMGVVGAPLPVLGGAVTGVGFDVRGKVGFIMDGARHIFLDNPFGRNYVIPDGKNPLGDAAKGYTVTKFTLLDIERAGVKLFNDIKRGLFGPGERFERQAANELAAYRRLVSISGTAKFASVEQKKEFMQWLSTKRDAIAREYGSNGGSPLIYVDRKTGRLVGSARVEVAVKLLRDDPNFKTVVSEATSGMLSEWQRSRMKSAVFKTEDIQFTDTDIVDDGYGRVTVGADASSLSLSQDSLEVMGRQGWSAEEVMDFVFYRQITLLNSPDLKDDNILTGYRIRRAIARQNAEAGEDSSSASNESEEREDRSLSGLINALSIAGQVSRIAGGRVELTVGLLSAAVSVAAARTTNGQIDAFGGLLQSFGALTNSAPVALTGTLVRGITVAATARDSAAQWAGIGSAVSAFGGLIGSRPVQVTGQVISAVASAFQVADQLRSIGNAYAGPGLPANATFALANASTVGWVQGIGALAGVASTFIPGTAGRVLGGVSNIANTYVTSAFQVAVGNVPAATGALANWVSIGTTVAGLVIGGSVGRWVSNVGSVVVPLLLSNPVGAAIALATQIPFVGGFISGVFNGLFGWLFGGGPKRVYSYTTTDSTGHSYNVSRDSWNRVRIEWWSRGAYWDNVNGGWTDQAVTQRIRQVRYGYDGDPPYYLNSQGGWDGEVPYQLWGSISQFSDGSDGWYYGIATDVNNTWNPGGSVWRSQSMDFYENFRGGWESQERLVDVDNDGDLDMIWRDPDRIRFFRNDSFGYAGTNQGHRTYTQVPWGNHWDNQGGVSQSALGGVVTYYKPGQDSYADVNGDGWLDLILSGEGVVHIGAGRNWVLFGNGAGGFAWPRQFGYVDSDNDGYGDLVLDGRYIHLNNGSNSFGGAIDAGIDWANQGAVNSFSHALARYDINGDGRSDVLASQWWDGTSNQRHVALRQADGGFWWLEGWQAMSAQQLAGERISADVNGDGRADSVWRSGLNRIYVTLQNSGGGYGFTFQATDGAPFVGAAYAAGQVVYKDINLDGRVDLSWGGRYIQLGNAGGGFSSAIDANVDWASAAATHAFWRSLATFDLNGDGRLDYFAQAWWSATDDRRDMYLQQADGGFLYIDGWTGMSAPQMAGEQVSADVNGDGLADAIWRSGLNRVYVSLKNASGSFGNTFVAANAKDWWSANFASGQAYYRDFNFDGRVDIMWETGHVQFGQMNGTFSGPVNLATDWNNPASVSTWASRFANYDLNGDGLLDALIQATWDADLRAVALQRPDGTFFLVHGWQAHSAQEQIGSRLSIDVNGDGVDDAVWRDVNQKAWVAFGRASGGFGGVIDFGTTGEPTDLRSIYQAEAGRTETSQDFNGDGRNDAIMNLGEGRTTALLMNADGTWVRSASVKRDNMWSYGETFLGDINGDGYTDTVFRDTRNTLWIGLGQRDTDIKTALVQQNVGGWGSSSTNYAGMRVFMADVDGDRKDDLIWWDTAGAMRLSKGQENGTFATPVSTPVFTWARGDYSFASVGDVDNDKQADILFSRAVVGTTGLTSEWVLMEATGGGLVQRATQSTVLPFTQFQGSVLKNTANGHYYLASNVAMTWEQGHAWARANGGDLVTINDAAEQAWVRANFNQTDRRYWIGINDVAQEGSFVWSSGETVSFTNWAPGEPNDWKGDGANPGGQDYGLMYAGSQGQWDDDVNDPIAQWGAGSTTFAIAEIAPERLTQLAHVLPVELRDVDNDGRSDFVRAVVDGSGNVQQASVRFGLADGTFDASVFTVLPTVDLNGDSTADQVFVRQSDATLWGAYGRPGSSTFFVRQQLGTKPDTTWTAVQTQVLVGDVNGDRRADQIWINRSSGNVRVFSATRGATQGAASVNASLFGSSGTYALGDVNGDGRNELVFTGTDGVLQAAFFKADGTIDVTIRSSVRDSVHSLGQTTKVDINGDGIEDAIFDPMDRKPTNPANDVWGTANFGTRAALGKADGSFGAMYNPYSVIGATNWSWFSYSDVLYGDVNGDGRADMVLNHNRTGGDFFVALGRADGQFANWTVVNHNLNWGFGGRYSLMDINGDDRMELVFSGNDGTLRAAFFNADGTFGSTMQSTLKGGVHSLGEAFRGDINGDGVADAVMRDARGTLRIALGNPGGGYRSVAVQNLRDWGDNNWAFTDMTVAAADVNGDGRMDLGWRHSDGRFWVALGKTDGTFTTPLGDGLGAQFVGAGTLRLTDLNSDGRSEAVYTYQNGSLKALFFGTDGGLASAVNSVARAGVHSLGEVFRGDVNGDGIVDTVMRDARSTLRIALGGQSGASAPLVLQNLRDWGDTDTGFNTYSVASGDLNGDGRMDLAWRHADGRLWVALGKTDGTFTVPSGDGLGVQFAGEGTMQVLDVNGDGRNEALYTYQTGSLKAIFFNPDGTLASSITSAARDGVQTLGQTVTADINGDGIADQVFNQAVTTAIAGTNSGTRISLGLGDGRYASSVNSTSWFADSNMYYADVNGDGKADLLMDFQRAGNKFHVALGRGDGTFGTWSTTAYNPGWGTAGRYSMADINSDGRSDLVFIGNNGNLRAALFTATGTVETTLSGVARDGVQTLGQSLSADINGDGIVDRIFNQAVTTAATGTNSGTRINLGRADGSFAAATFTTSWYADSNMFYGDVNGDGRADLVMDFQRAGSIYVALGQSTGTFGGWTTSAYNPGWGITGQYGLSDINSDGRLELVFTGSNGVMRAAFFKADGTIDTTLTSASRDGVQTLGQSISADVNGDGIADQIFNHSTTTTIAGTNSGTRVSLGRAEGGFAVATTSTSWYGDSDMRYADINGDGRTDLVMDFQRAGDKFYTALGQTNGTFGAWTLSAYNPGWGIAGRYELIDIDGDSAADLVFTGNDGAMRAAFFKADGTIDTTIASTLRDGVHTLGQRVSADINGDGVADAIFNRPVVDSATTGSRIHIGQVDGSFASPTAAGSWYGNSDMFYADVNGDQAADLIVNRTRSGSDFFVALGQSSGTFSAWTVSAYNPGWGAAGVYSMTDINLDGRAELLFTGFDGTRRAAFFKSDGTVDSTITSAVRDGVQTLGQTYSVDVNGDGITDRIFNRTQTGLITATNTGTSVSLGRADGTFAPALASTSWYSDSDMFYGDVNGDGRSDLVMDFQRAGNKFYVALGQVSGTFGGWSLAAYNPGWGTDGTYSLADINSDGRVDLKFSARDGSFKAASFTATGTLDATFSSIMLRDASHSMGNALQADLNGDGQMDLVYRSASNAIRVALGDSAQRTGFGTWAAVSSAVPLAGDLGAGYSATFQDALQLVDVDGDGKSDLVWARTDTTGLATGQTVVLRSTSTATAATFALASAANTQAGEVSLSDVDGDGRMDLVRSVRDGSGTVTSRRTFFGQSTGAFGTTALVGASKNGQIILGESAMADLNGDGQLDLVFRSAGNAVRVAFGDASQPTGYGAWSAVASALPVTGDLGAGISATFQDTMAVTDTDGDGRADLVWTRVDAQGVASGASVTLRSTSTASTASFALASNANGASGALTLVDVDGDGSTDYMRTIRDGSGAVTGRSVTFGSGQSAVTGVSKAGEFIVGELFRADINGDGQQDRVFRAANNTLRVALGDASQTDGLGSWNILSGGVPGINILGANYTPTFQDELQVVDVNRDGKADLVWARVDSAGKATGASVTLLSTSSGATISFGAPGTADSTAGEATLADIDGDGGLDLVRTVRDGSGAVTGRSARFATGQSAITAVLKDAEWALGDAFRADVNADGQQDLVFRSANNSVRIALGDRTQASGYGAWSTITSAVPATGALGTSYSATFQDEMVLADIDGDRDSDLVWVRTDTMGSPTGEVVVMRSTSTATAASFGTASVANTASGEVGLSDIDGDGRIDLIRTNRDGAGNITSQSVYFGQTTGVFSTSALAAVKKDGQWVFGESFSADMNGDLVQDAVFRTSGNAIRVALGSVSATTGNVSFGTWSTLTGAVAGSRTFADSMQVGDVQGDGRADFVWVSVDSAGKPTGAASLMSNTGTASTFTWTAVDINGTTAGVDDSAAGQAYLADVNGDGRADLVRRQVSAAGATTAISMLPGQTGGGFSAASAAAVLRRGEFSLGDQFDVDFNGDGVQDSVFRNSANTVSVSFGTRNAATGAVTFGSWSNIATAAPTGVTFEDYLQVVDVNGDAKADLVWTKAGVGLAAAGSVTIQRNTTSGSTASVSNNNTAASTSGMTDSGEGVVSWADLNGDGRNDLIRTSGDVVTARLGAVNGGLESTTLTVQDTVFAPPTSSAVLDLSSYLSVRATVQGDARHEAFAGTAWSDRLSGGAGHDILRGQAGSDLLNGEAGNDALLGGTGADVLSGGEGNNFIASGSGDDLILTTRGANVLAFNLGDGRDSVVTQGETAQDDTISLGGGVSYSGIALAKNGLDLELYLNAGGTDRVIMRDWYLDATHRSVSTLQVVTEGTADYLPSSGNATRDHKVERYNFVSLVGQFDTARAANPGITTWAVSSALAGLNVGGADTAALGGDLAYAYARGTLANVGHLGAANVLGASTFGSAAQSFQADALRNSGSFKLG